MKLIFESWREYLNEQQGAVDVKFPDVIPDELLQLGDEDPEIGGFVYPEEDRQRAGIYLDDELVGFMTPRKEPDGRWRAGAIYLDPESRGKGIGSEAIANFFVDKDASPLPIGVDNIASQKAFTKAGFILLDPDKVLTDESDDWQYQMWGPE